MYLSFVVAEIDEDSQQDLGVFQAIHKLEREGKLAEREQEQSALIDKWFDKNLRKPTRFTSSKPPFYRKKNKAISWFKDKAYEHLSQIRSLVAILENHGVGYIVYEDEYQIVAEPFADRR